MTLTSDSAMATTRAPSRGRRCQGGEVAAAACAVKAALAAAVSAKTMKSPTTRAQQGYVFLAPPIAQPARAVPTR